MPQSVPELFVRTLASRRAEVALRWKHGDAWEEMTWGDYADGAARVAGALRALGVGAGDRVALMLRNRPEFHIADTAALFLGAAAFSIYNSSAPDQIEYLLGHSEAAVVIVDDVSFLERVLKVRSELPKLAHVIVVDDPEGLAPDGVESWASLLDGAPVDLDAELGNARPDGLATIIYTSGTTGPPKGVMLDHANIVWTGECYQRTIGVPSLAGWRVVSYLPMAHIAERMSSYYLGIAVGLEITTCPEPGLVGPYLVQVRPQSFFAVPRVWEKMHAGLRAAIDADPKLDGQAIQAALAIGWEVSEYDARGDAVPEPLAAQYAPVAPLLAGMRAKVGLDQLETCLSGAAPIPVEVLQFFRGLGLPLSEIYGLSETTGPMTWEAFRVRVGTVGRAMPGVEVRLGEDGEVECRGGNVFRGYLNAPDKTAEVLDDDGWFHSGDIGVLDDDGYLRIVDRKKELIITAGGKNISPANLEAALKSGALIGQACVIGDNQPYITALVVLDAETAPGWAKAHGIDTAGLTLTELAAHPEVQAEIEREVAEANARFSQAERIKRWTVLADEWQPDSEELTPTMKLKRRGVHRKYADEIRSLYA